MENNEMKLADLIDELTDVINSSPNAMLSKKKAVQYDLVMEILGDMRDALPEDLEYCELVMREKDQIIDQARNAADRMIAEARRQVDEMASREEVVKLAQEKATAIIDRAKTKSAELKNSANSYAEDVLNDMEQYFGEYLELVRENRNRLQHKSDTHAANVARISEPSKG